MSDVVIALATMHYSVAGQIRKGDLWEASHPVVLAHPDWFSADLLAYAVRAPEVVEKRAPGRPKKEPEPATSEG